MTIVFSTMLVANNSSFTVNNAKKLLLSRLLHVEDGYPAIIDKEMWEAVQLEMERRRAYALEHGIQNLSTLQLTILLQAGLYVALAGRFLARKFGIRPIICSGEGSSGAAMVNTR
ncbi:MAG: hypothetical protein AB9917_24085 [Negativicutes bacterium]